MGVKNGLEKPDAKAIAGFPSYSLISVAGAVNTIFKQYTYIQFLNNI